MTFRRLVFVALSILAGTVPAAAQQTDQRSGLVIPAWVFVGLQAGDLISTRAAVSIGNGREGNPLMGSGTGAKAIALKAASTAATLYAARQIEKRGHRKAAKVTLWVLNGALAGVVIHNARIATR